MPGDLFGVEISAIGNDGEFVQAQRLPGALRHRRQGRPVAAALDDIVGNDQVMARLHRHLYIVSYNAGAAAAGRHGTGIRVGQRTCSSGDAIISVSNTCRRCISSRNLPIFSLRRSTRDAIAGVADWWSALLIWCR